MKQTLPGGMIRPGRVFDLGPARVCRSESYSPLFDGREKSWKNCHI
jgi:hypothetical protein